MTKLDRVAVHATAVVVGLGHGLFGAAMCLVAAPVRLVVATVEGYKKEVATVDAIDADLKASGYTRYYGKVNKSC